MVMGSLVIAVYRPKRGKSKELLELVRSHVPILRRLGLATQREVVAGKARDGSILEIFEWVSEEAIDRAHHDPVVQRLWKRFNAVSDSVALSALAEGGSPFPGFEPLDLGPRIGSVDWIDMTSGRAESLKRFYAGVVGLEPDAVEMGDYRDYAMLGANGRAACGICHDRGANASVPPGWLPYFTVASVARSVAAAKRLGGSVIDGPRTGGGGRFCVLRDPSGSHLALYQPLAAPRVAAAKKPGRSAEEGAVKRGGKPKAKRGAAGAGTGQV